MRTKKTLAVLVSGAGSNLQRILDAITSGEMPNIEISVVISDRDCFALQRAKDQGIPHLMIPKGKEFSEQLNRVLSFEDLDLIVLAGFLSILSPQFCEQWKRKIINIHPSLLPKFGGKGMWGMNVHQAVINAKERTSGASVHWVTSGIDEGVVVLQQSCSISDNETPESLAEKIHHIEQDLLPKAIVNILQV